MIISENENLGLVNIKGENAPVSMQDSTYEAMMEYQSVYPEIYYKLQPYIMMVCDQMDYHTVMPNLDMVQKMTDSIYDDVCKMYPDLEEYAHNSETNPDVVPVVNFNPHNPHRRRFRRRGLFKDIIDILLLSELFHRRRRRY